LQQPPAPAPEPTPKGRKKIIKQDPDTGLIESITEVEE
jgi:hypothetical protein